MSNEVLNARVLFYEASLDYTIKINELNGLKRQDLLENLLSVYFAYYDYYREAWSCFQSTQPIMLELKSKRVFPKYLVILSPFGPMDEKTRYGFLVFFLMYFRFLLFINLQLARIEQVS